MLLSEADAAQDGFLHKLNKQTRLHSFHSLEAVIIIAVVVCAQWALCIVYGVPADLGTYFCGNSYFLVSILGFAHLPTHFIYFNFICLRIIIEIGICHDSIETQCPFISIHKIDSSCYVKGMVIHYSIFS